MVPNITPTMENQMEKNMENEMEAGIIYEAKKEWAKTVFKSSLKQRVRASVIRSCFHVGTCLNSR